MIKTSDGTQVKRTSGIGDRQPLLGGRKLRALYTSVSGGETSIDLSLLTPAISYAPGNNQISVKRSSGGNPISGIDFYELTASSIGFPISDPLLAGETVEITLDFLATGVMACTPRPDVYSDIGTVGQTLVTANFSWPYNLNSGSGIGAVKLIIEGIIQTRGSANDYTEVSLGTANTNQILLTTALLGGEKIIILPTYQMIDQSAAASTFYGQAYSGVQNTFGAGTQAFIDQSTLISAPNTTIINRAKIPDLANDLRASFGIERIPTQQIMLVQNEMGTNGELVYAALNDDRGLIRFVGNWIANTNNLGPNVTSLTAGDYIEVTFYGTGINWLLTSASTPTGVVYASIDGGSEGANLFTANRSNNLITRGYPLNHILPLYSGLTLGIHTLKIRQATVEPGFGLPTHGFEIIGPATININPGSCYFQGRKINNNYTDSIAYNTGVTGVKGGRIVRYFTADNTVTQAFTPVDTTALYGNSADHTNEELARQYSPREFGCGRYNATYSSQDDFSLMTATGRAAAFTLDDNLTTLVTSSAAISAISGSLMEGLWPNNSNWITFTFEGCGLDLVMFSNGAGTNGATDVQYQIDGGTVTNWFTTSYGNTKVRIQKVVSGLPYGTHTFRIIANVPSNWIPVIVAYRVYQPKKPTFVGVEICDYNVVADFVTGTMGLETVATGIIRKQNMREHLHYSGWPVTTALNLGASASGYDVYTNTNGAMVDITFYGTGFELRGYADTSRSTSVGVLIDGATATGTITTYGGWTYSSPNLNCYSTSPTGPGAGLRVSGLTLGKHTVRFTNNTTGYFNCESLDVITPIRSYKSNLYADIQNTLSVGSNSLMDSRKISMIKEILPAQKAWAQAVGVTSSPTTTATSPVPCPDMSCTVKTSGGALKIHYTITYYNGADMNPYLQVYVDGSGVGAASMDWSRTVGSVMSSDVIVPVSAGFHKVDLYWWGNTGTTTAFATYRILSVNEL